YGLFLRDMQRDQGLESAEDLKVGLALRANQNSLNKDLARFETTRSHTDSIFATYLFGTTLLALPLPAAGAVKKMDEMLSDVKDPAGLPYGLSGSASPRGSVGRSLLMQFAGYLKAPNDGVREVQRKNLGQVIETYLDHVPSLQDHVLHNASHTG